MWFIKADFITDADPVIDSGDRHVKISIQESMNNSYLEFRTGFKNVSEISLKYFLTFSAIFLWLPPSPSLQSF